MNKNKIFIRGREKSDRGREVGLEGEGSGGRGGGNRGERGREVGNGYPPVHPLQGRRFGTSKMHLSPSVA